MVIITNCPNIACHFPARNEAIEIKKQNIIYTPGTQHTSYLLQGLTKCEKIVYNHFRNLRKTIQEMV